MDNQMLYQLFLSMLSKMSEEEIEIALKKAESAMSPQDFEQLKKIISEKRG